MFGNRTTLYRKGFWPSKWLPPPPHTLLLLASSQQPKACGSVLERSISRRLRWLAGSNQEEEVRFLTWETPLKAGVKVMFYTDILRRKYAARQHTFWSYLSTPLCNEPYRLPIATVGYKQTSVTFIATQATSPLTMWGLQAWASTFLGSQVRWINRRQISNLNRRTIKEWSQSGYIL